MNVVHYFTVYYWMKHLNTHLNNVLMRTIRIARHFGFSTFSHDAVQNLGSPILIASGAQHNILNRPNYTSRIFLNMFNAGFLDVKQLVCIFFL